MTASYLLKLNLRSARIVVIAGVLTAVAASIAMSTGVASGVITGVPDLAANLGISTYTAKKAIDLVTSWWGFAAAVALTGGWTAALLGVAKKLAAKYGAAWATSW